MLIPPDKLRKILIITFGIIFVFLGIQVRFHMIFMQVLDATTDFAVNNILSLKIPLYLGLGNLFSHYWVVISLIAVMVAFLYLIKYKIAAWWFAITQLIAMLLTWVITIILRIHWQDGPKIGETIPNLLLVWWLQLLLLLVIIMPYLVKSRKIQVMINILIGLFWLSIMLARIQSHHMALTSGLGAITFGYFWWQFSAQQYYKRARHWQKVLEIDGRV